MAYDVLVLDVDGTLVNSSKKITPKTRDAIIECQENGIKVAIASGRCTEGIRNQIKEIQLDKFGGYCISFNGGCITNCATGEIIYNEMLPDNIVYELYDYSVEHQMGFLTYHNGKMIAHSDTDPYITGDADGCQLPIWVPEDFHKEVNFPVNKFIITGEPEELKMLEIQAAQEFAGRISIYRSEDFYLEMMPLGVDKAYGIAKLLQQIGYHRTQTICCGDGHNDLSMIDYAGLGIAMANSSEELIRHADYIAPSCDEDGIVDVINLFLKDW